MRGIAWLTAAAVPLLLTVAGIYIVVFTPDVVTTSTTYIHSHNDGLGLVMLALLAGAAVGGAALVVHES